MAVAHLKSALAIAGLALAVTACSAGTQVPLQSPAAPPAAAGDHASRPTPATPADPIEALLAESTRHFKAGQQELAVGHLESARREFDRSIDVLTESPYGARYDARLRQHFDRLVDQISAYELRALAEGDGFTEQRPEPASIDTLLEQTTSAASDATTRAVSSDLENTAHDVPIPLNGRVLSYIELFQGRLHDWFAAGLERGAQYLPMIQNVFRAEGLPLDLAYVPLIESAFNPNAVSRAKAKGVWQFMAETAGEQGLKRDWYIDERADPEKATRAAAAYLQTLVGIFNGDWHLALASYNGGPGLVQRAIKRSGLSDFWALSDKGSYLPRETREYVPMILAAMVIARNPGQYGFSAPAEVPLQYDKVSVSHPVDLRRIAEWAGTDVSQIQALNPELRRWTTPIRYPGYEIKVPKGTGATIEARLDEISSSDAASLKWYTVKRGDTLITIARKLRVARTDLAAANYLPTRARVRPGQNLVIPVEPALLMAGRPDMPAPAGPSLALAEEHARMPRARAAAAQAAARVTYRVKRGDTLSAVARLYRTTVESLKAWNGLTGDLLRPGARLTIFTSALNR